jgi:hypothetical protein
MTSHASSCSSPNQQRQAIQRQQIANWSWPLTFGVAFVFAFMLMPGYFGGGADDAQYLYAARCWVDNGPCLPTNHWEGRWPAILPVAAAISMLGESRFTVALWPFLSGATALGLVICVGNRIGGSPAGWLAAILVLFTPTFSTLFLTPNVELLELALILTGVLAVGAWTESRKAVTAAAAALAFSMAFQVRETAIIAAAMAAAFVVSRRPSLRHLLVAMMAFLAPLLIEFILYWQLTGDPLYRRKLSVGHTLLISPELLGPVDTLHGPFFNKAYIANWRREPGIYVHWLIDGPLNLLLNARAGWSLAFVGVLLTVLRGRISKSAQQRAFVFVTVCISYVFVLIYALAVDPKPRIMLVPLTISSVALAVLLTALWRNGERAMAQFLVAGHILSGAAILFVQPRVQPIEDGAQSWIARFPGALEADPYTLRHLALVPDISHVASLGTQRPFLLHATELGCTNVLVKAGLADDTARLVGVRSMARVKNLNAGWELCLFQYRERFDRSQIWSNLQQSFLK